MSKKSKTSIIQVPQMIWRFIKEAREELKKVTWPTRETTIRYTIIVVLASVAVGGVIGGVDYVFALLLERVI